MRGCRVSTGPRRGLSKLQRELSQTVPLANFAAQVIATSGVLQGRPSREQAGGIRSGWDMALSLCSCLSSPRCSDQHSARSAAGLSSGLLGLSHLLPLALQRPMMMLMEAAIVTPLRAQGDFPRPARALHLGVRAPHLSLLHRCEAEHPPPASHSSTSQGLTPPLPAPALEEVQVLWCSGTTQKAYSPHSKVLDKSEVVRKMKICSLIYRGLNHVAS